MSTIVEAVNLSRFYGIILGLNNVNFTVRDGITGVVGPNGAGKTTLFRLLTGQIKPSAGDIRVFGARPWNNPDVINRIGYCPESESVPRGLRPVEWLTALGRLSGFSRTQARERANFALAQVRLPDEHRKKRLPQLSKGLRQRVKLAQCLLHNPKLVILDEPMNGLDPMGREEFSQVLRDLAANGASIVISSHILHDLEALCSEFIPLRWGRIPQSIAAETGAEARRRWPSSTTIRCDQPERLARFFIERGLVQGWDVDPDENLVHLRWKKPDDFYSDFHSLLLESKIDIYEVRSTASFLERLNATT